MFCPPDELSEDEFFTDPTDNQVGEPVSAEEFLRNVQETDPETYKIISEKYPVLSNPLKKRIRDLDTDFQEGDVESTDAGSTRRRADREIYRQWMSDQWS